LVFSVTRICIVFGIFVTTGVGAFGQDAHDPLVFGPGIPVGSRLQYGENVLPVDWSYQGNLSEAVTEDDGIPGFRIVTLLDAAIPRNGSGEGFDHLDGDFIGTTPVVTAFAQNGEKHRFLVDTGALHSYIRPSVAEALNGGQDIPFPMALQVADHKWLHFKVEVDRNVAVLATPDPDFPVDGILGMNAIACMQLKIDYVHRKLWARLAKKPLDASQAATELGIGKSTVGKDPVKSVAMKRQASGRYAIEAILDGKVSLVEVDTGANVIGLSPSAISKLGMDHVGEGSVLVEAGTKSLATYLARSAKVDDISLIWPVIHQGQTQDQDVGGFGPSVFPHQAVIIDYPGSRLFTLTPTEDELVEQAVGQLISGVVRLEGKETVLDLPEIVGKSRAVLVKIQDQPVNLVIQEIRSLSKGDLNARARLIALYKQLNTNGHISIRQNGIEREVQTSAPHD